MLNQEVPNGLQEEITLEDIAAAPGLILYHRDNIASCASCGLYVTYAGGNALLIGDFVLGASILP